MELLQLSMLGNGVSCGVVLIDLGCKALAEVDGFSDDRVDVSIEGVKHSLWGGIGGVDVEFVELVQAGESEQ